MMMKKALPGHQISLRDMLILFLGISCILGLLITRLQAFKALHEEIRFQSNNVFQLKLADQAQGDMDVERIARLESRVASVEREANRHITMTFVLLGVLAVCFGLGLTVSRFWASKTRITCQAENQGV